MTTTSLRTGSVLVFDGDCGFCTTSVTWLERQLPGAFATVPYQRTDLEALGLTADECDARVQWIGDVAAPVTTREQGARAVGALLKAGGAQRGGPTGAAARALGALTGVPPTSWAAAGIYAVVARNRHRMPGGTPACRI